MVEFKSKNSRVDLINSIGLPIVFEVYSLEKIKNSKSLMIDISEENFIKQQIVDLWMLDLGLYFLYFRLRW